MGFEPGNCGVFRRSSPARLEPFRDGIKPYLVREIGISFPKYCKSQLQAETAIHLVPFALCGPLTHVDIPYIILHGRVIVEPPTPTWGIVQMLRIPIQAIILIKGDLMFILKGLRKLCVACVTVLAAATASQAAVVDFTFSQNSWSFGVGGIVTSDLAGVDGYGFGFGGVDIGFRGAFRESSGESKAIVSLTPTTYGPVNQPSGFYAGYGAEFANAGQSLFASDIDGGFIGVLSSGGNYGYIELDWNATSKVITILSAKYETVAGQAISAPFVAAVPLPAGGMLLLTGFAGLAFLRRRDKPTN